MIDIASPNEWRNVTSILYWKLDVPSTVPSIQLCHASCVMVERGCSPSPGQLHPYPRHSGQWERGIIRLASRGFFSVPRQPPRRFHGRLSAELTFSIMEIEPHKAQFLDPRSPGSDGTRYFSVVFRTCKKYGWQNSHGRPSVGNQQIERRVQYPAHRPHREQGK